MEVRAQPTLSPRCFHTLPWAPSSNRAVFCVHGFSFPWPTPYPWIQGNVPGNDKVIWNTGTLDNGILHSETFALPIIFWAEGVSHVSIWGTLGDSMCKILWIRLCKTLPIETLVKMTPGDIIGLRPRTPDRAETTEGCCTPGSGDIWHQSHMGLEGLCLLHLSVSPILGPMLLWWGLPRTKHWLCGDVSSCSDADSYTVSI